MRLNLPWTDHRELEEIAKVLQTGFFTQGPVVAQFEDQVAALVGSKYAFATSSCTTALHLALAALDIGPGDEVLVADFTFPATANVIVQLRAKPVLVDIELQTFTIDINDLRRKVSAQTKAIMPVDAFGCPADLNPILELAKKIGIPVVEDAACALGATYQGKPCGSISTATCFSFHPRKSVTTGEGGMVMTNDPVLAERLQLLRSHGGVRKEYWFEYFEAGFNYRLSDIQGAMGIAQLEKLPKSLELKKNLATALTDRLEDIPCIQPPSVPTWGEHAFQSYVVMLDKHLNRDQIISDLRALDIECTLGTYALHDQPFYQREFGYVSGQLPNSHAAFTRSIALPFYPQMTETDLDTLVKAFRKVLEKNKIL